MRIAFTNTKLNNSVSPVNSKYCQSSIHNTRKAYYVLDKRIEQDTFVSNEPSFDISFNGKIDDDTRKKCHLVIHGASAVCAATSAAMGEGAAVGADTPFLWGAQGLMFLSLQKLLNVNTADHAMYIVRQLAQGQALGVGGAKILLSWMGIAGEAATLGSGTPVITSALRGVNATLSGGITEKMGWGYVFAVEKDNMTLGKQFLQTAIYGIGMEFFGSADDLPDTSNIFDIGEAFEQIPKENLKTYGKIMNILVKDLHADRFAFLLGCDFAQSLCFCKKPLSKENIKRMLSTAIFNTALYDLLDYQYDKTVEQETLNTIKKLGQDIKNTPEVFQEFEEIKQDLFNKLDIDKISNSQEFLDKFKNKDFVHNFAILSSEASSLFADKWRKRNFAKYKEQNEKIKRGLSAEKQKSDDISNKLTPEQKAELNNNIKKLAETAKTSLNNKTKANFALSKIGGYDNIKALLALSLINPIKEKANIVPSTIMFYGPSGMGKTALGMAIAEDCGTRFITHNIGFSNPEKWLSKLNDKLKSATDLYKTTGRRTIIQINEIDDLANCQKITDDLAEIFTNSAKKYGCTFLLTTNNPLSVVSKIKQKTELFVPVDIPTEEDIKEIIKIYLNKKEIKNFDIDEIANAFYTGQNEAIYSNAQIENIITRLLPPKCTQKEFLAIIKETNPCVSKEVIEKFNVEKEKLVGEYK